MLPRQTRGAARRGPGRFRFGYREVAAACGRALHTVRSDLRLDAPVETVVAYVTRALSHRAERLSDADAASALGCGLAAWRDRWPQFDVYRCPAVGCSTLLLEAGLCPEHGGPKHPFASLGNDHVYLRIGGQDLPFCRIVIGSNAPRVDHVDCNSWNCAPSNLSVPASDAGRRSWRYTYADLAHLLEMSEDGVRQAVSRGILDPSSLTSVCSFWALRKPEIE